MESYHPGKNAFDVLKDEFLTMTVPDTAKRNHAIGVIASCIIKRLKNSDELSKFIPVWKQLFKSNHF